MKIGHFSNEILPLITTRHGTLPEKLVDKKTGFLCRNVDEMVAGVKRVHDISPHDCRNHVLWRFHYMRMAEDYLGLYTRLISEYTKN